MYVITNEKLLDQVSGGEDGDDLEISTGNGQQGGSASSSGGDGGGGGGDGALTNNGVQTVVITGIRGTQPGTTDEEKKNIWAANGKGGGV